ncbi:MAG: hypothetical protein F4Z74_04660 [Acidobacteria bacterium]|nr:hypothetical protein [Acidobacteriota bacterium]MYE44175.1 hypothetical protein [Acidobacteriota bacterium]
MEGRILRLIFALLLLAGSGCTTIQTLLPQDTAPDPTNLPGGDGPLRATCQELGETAVQQVPIQYRDRLGQSVALVAYQECIEVLVVMVSVAMVAGDTTQDGVDAVRAQLAGADSQYLADTCDDHFRSWRFLRNPEIGYLNALEGASAGNQYDGWMDRCYRVVRPLSVGGEAP